MPMYTITNLETGETLRLSRDVRTSHPEWVLRQLEVETESDLQAYLDVTDPEYYYHPDGTHKGPDDYGIAAYD